MPTVDLAQLVHSAVEKNKGIPAMLDAYSEFVDSPIGPLELQDLESVFSAILGNLSERFPQIASGKAATNARNDVSAFLAATNSDADRVKTVLARELHAVDKFMAASISERFSRMSVEERRAIDATLRLVRRSEEDILFRSDLGKGIESSGPEFEKFFAPVKAQSPSMKELRYQNLIVEKAIFNKLILKKPRSQGGDNQIWVPAFFAKENIDYLIEKAGVVSEHLFYSRLKEIKDQGKLDEIKPLLSHFIKNNGVLLSSEEKMPSEIEDFVVRESGKLLILSPLELDDASRLLEEETNEQQRLVEEKEEQRRAQESQERNRLEEIERQKQLERRKRIAISQEGQQAQTLEIRMPERQQFQSRKSEDSIYLGKTLDVNQFVGALNRRAPEKEIESQVKSVDDYLVELPEIRQSGIAIIGSSGSGRSTTLRRLLDGLASTTNNSGGGVAKPRVIVLDQKGEHRGIAWKYKWNVLGFASDTQSKQMRLRPFLSSEDEEGGSELSASILQEWLLQAGVNCGDQQRARIASIIRAQGGSATGESISKALLGETELAQLGQKLAKNFLAKNAMSRIFAENPDSPHGTIVLGDGSVIFDVSGRGLKDPTTKEERLIASVLLMKTLLDLDVQSSIVVLEDVLDRFKSDNLRKKVVHYVSRLHEKGNTIVATARSQIREFVGGDALEILHRLSGEKVVAEELAGFKMTNPIRNLGVLVTFLPRGYAFTSSIMTRSAGGEARTVPSSAIRVEPLQFSTAVA
jgi:hypothetical protein